jgi:chromosome segregation ATPase
MTVIGDNKSCYYQIDLNQQNYSTQPQAQPLQASQSQSSQQLYMSHYIIQPQQPNLNDNLWYAVNDMRVSMRETQDKIENISKCLENITSLHTSLEIIMTKVDFLSNEVNKLNLLSERIDRMEGEQHSINQKIQGNEVKIKECQSNIAATNDTLVKLKKLTTELDYKTYKKNLFFFKH